MEGEKPKNNIIEMPKREGDSFPLGRKGKAEVIEIPTQGVVLNKDDLDGIDEDVDRLISEQLRDNVLQMPKREGDSFPLGRKGKAEVIEIPTTSSKTKHKGLVKADEFHDSSFVYRLKQKIKDFLNKFWLRQDKGGNVIEMTRSGDLVVTEKPKAEKVIKMPNRGKDLPDIVIPNIHRTAPVNLIGIDKEQYIEDVLTVIKGLEAKGEYLLVIRFCKDILKVTPDDISIINKIADMNLALGRYNGAIEAYKDILSFDPNNFQAWLGLAVATEHSPDPEYDTDVCYRKAIDINFVSKEARLGYGKYLAKKSEIMPALRNLNLYVKLVRSENNEPDVEILELIRKLKKSIII